MDFTAKQLKASTDSTVSFKKKFEVDPAAGGSSLLSWGCLILCQTVVIDNLIVGQILTHDVTLIPDNHADRANDRLAVRAINTQ